jgi:hypothetical protein
MFMGDKSSVITRTDGDKTTQFIALRAASLLIHRQYNG